MSNKSTGAYGESLACDFLKKLGYKILERNFRIRGGELDIIAKDGDEVVFVEVKTRYTHEFGDPAESVTPAKVRFLIRAAQFYLLQHKLIDSMYRIDVVTVDFTNGQQIEHLKSITL